jgi:hypothetical protein
MTRRLLRFIGEKSHNVTVQMFIASVYGSVCLYGAGGTYAILVKLRDQAIKQAKKQALQLRKEETDGNQSIREENSQVS